MTIVTKDKIDNNKNTSYPYFLKYCDRYVA